MSNVQSLKLKQFRFKYSVRSFQADTINALYPEFEVIPETSIFFHTDIQSNIELCKQNLKKLKKVGQTSNG